MAEGDINRQVNEIRDDLASLRSDLAALMKLMRDEGVNRGRSAYGAARDKAREAGERVQEGMGDARDTVGREIGARPLTSVLTAFGVGFIIGLVLDRHR